MNQTTPEPARNWRAGTAIVWRCAGCRMIIGFIDPPLTTRPDATLRVVHERRIIECTGHHFQQTCDECSVINAYSIQGPAIWGRFSTVTREESEAR